MEENKAAIKIQSFFRMLYVQKNIVQKVRNEFEELVQVIGDTDPNWKKKTFCCPSFQELSTDIERMFIEGAILQRIAILHYQKQVSKDE